MIISLFNVRGTKNNHLSETMSYSDTYTTDHEEKLLKLVCQNPFRILGVFSNASLKEITANKTKLARYASVGKSVSFDADMNGLLPPVTRTTESVEKAFADLSLSQDKLKHAMLWFMKCTSYDEDAFSKLAAGNVKEAKLVWEVHSSLSSVQNRIVWR